MYMLAGKDLIKTHNIFIEPFVVIQDCENFFLRSSQSLRRNTKLSELTATYFIQYAKEAETKVLQEYSVWLRIHLVEYLFI